MSAYVVLFISIASSLALISLGGGLYEFLVVDPAWPRCVQTSFNPIGEGYRERCSGYLLTQCLNWPS